MSDELKAPARFWIRTEFLCDWHCGTGAGEPGGIDRLVHRDEEGLPDLPGKTLTGVLRDACEEVAQGLGEGWMAIVNSAFGDQPARATTASDAEPKPAGLNIRQGRYPRILREAILKSGDLAKEVCIQTHSTAIDRKSGTAAEQSLRIIERARAGSVMLSEASMLVEDQASQRNAFALFVAGCIWLDRLGAKRRRGAGRCKVSLWRSDNEGKPSTEIGAEQLEKWISLLKNPPESCGQAKIQGEHEGAPHSENNDTDWLRFDATITTIDAVIVSEEVIGNHVRSRDFIPGTFLLPIVARALREAKVQGLDTAIGDGDVLALNAYPCLADGQRGMPVPLAWHQPKGAVKKATAVNRLLAEPKADVQHKQMRRGYVAREGAAGASVNLRETTLQTRLHNTVNDDKQRPVSDEVGIYSYSAIAPGSKFKAEIRIRKSILSNPDQDGPRIQAALEGRQTIGRSKKDDYGRVDIQCAAISEPDPRRIGASEGDRLTVWLQSDLLLRGPNLLPAADIETLRQELGRLSGLDLEFDKDAGGIERIFARTRRTDSWNVRWGLPRPSLIGLAAGTVVTFKIKRSTEDVYAAAAKTLKRLESEGIGERRAEGFGQVCFNHELLAMDCVEVIRGDAAGEAGNQTTGDALKDPMDGNHDGTFLEHLRNEALLNWARLRADQLASNPDFRSKALGWKVSKSGESSPPRSQLGNLRMALSFEGFDGQDSFLAKWLAKTEANPRRKEKWGNALEPIKQIACDQNRSMIWELLAANPSVEKLPAVGPLRNEVAKAIAQQIGCEDKKGRKLRNRVWPDVVRIFFDACMRAHQRSGEKEGGA